MFTLRDYQEKAVESGVRYFNDKKNNKPAVIVIPTGGGKSLVIANIAKRLDGKTIVFQPSKELLEQNLSKYRSYGEEASVYSASMGIKEVGNVTFATIGSVKNLSHVFSEFKYCIIDECHLVPPASGSMYRNFLSKLKIKILGLTATPIRLKQYSFPEVHSKLNMLDRQRPKVFNQYIHITQISQLVTRGFFANINYASLSFDRRSLRVNSTGGDFTDSSIHDAFEYQNTNDKIIRVIRHGLHSGGGERFKHVLVFVPSIADAECIVRGKSDWACVSSKTSKKERDRVISQFKSGEIKVVANVGVLGVGFDFPELDTIIMARPTLSLAVYYQMIGRGVRPHPSKRECMVVDVVGNFNLFGRVEDLQIKNSNGWAIFSADRQLTNVPISSESERIETVLDNDTIGFGKYHGDKLKDLPSRYLTWVYENVKETSRNKYIFDYIRKSGIKHIET